MTELVVNDNATILLSSSTDVLYSVKNSPKTSKVSDALSNGDDVIAFWGDANDFPKKVDQACELNSDLASSLDWLARLLYSGGVSYKVLDCKTGAESSKRVADIDAFLFRNFQYPFSACKNLFKYVNIFPQMNLSKDRAKIDWLINRPSGHCRHSLQNKKGEIRDCYINAQWSEGAGVEDKETVKFPSLNSLTVTKEDLQSDNRGLEYIYPLFYPNGKIYYQLADWNGIRNNGWLDLANEVPKLKMAIMKNQITIKYHVRMPDYWMAWKYEDWDKLSQKERVKKTKEEVKKFDDFLKGSEHAGKTITSTYRTDEHTGKEFPGWQIVPIDDKLKDGMYLEDSQEATIKIFSALGIDPSLFGIIPGKGGSNRSGSDKREAMNIAVSLLQAHADIVLRPYNFISYYNGWNNEEQWIQWSFNRPLLQTLDKVTPKRRETVISDEE